MRINKLAVAVLAAMALVGCDKGAVASSDVKTDTSSSVARESAVSTTKELTTTKEQKITTTQPLLPMLWEQVADVNGEIPIFDDLTDAICNGPTHTPEDYSKQAQQVIGMWEQTNAEPESKEKEFRLKLLQGWEHFKKPQQEMARVCAGVIASEIFGRTYAGWEYSDENPRAGRQRVMIKWFAAAEPTVQYLSAAVDAVANVQGLTESEYRELMEAELRKAAPAFVEGLTQGYLKANQNHYTADGTGFDGVRFLVKATDGNYDLQGTKQGTTIYKNGVPYLGGNNYINGKQHYLQVVQTNAAAATRASGSRTINTNQVGGGVEGRAGTQ